MIAAVNINNNAKLLPVSSIKLILNCQHTSLPKTMKHHINGHFIQKIFVVKWSSPGSSEYIFEGDRLVTVTVNLKRFVELLGNCLKPQLRQLGMDRQTLRFHQGGRPVSHQSRQ